MKNNSKKPDAISYSQFERWHELLNALCDANGLAGNSELAYEICRKSGRNSQRDLESISRNVANWRKGGHVPNRKNFRLLTDLFGLKETPDLLKLWNKLYREETLSTGKLKKTGYVFQAYRTWFKVAVSFAVILAVGVFTGMYLATGQITATQQAAEPWQENYIEWKSSVTLKVGEIVVVHGYRGDCGDLPPDADEVATKFPKNLKTGRLVAGDIGVRLSRKCNGKTPAREVLFFAENPGTETFLLFEDSIEITVEQ